MKALRWHAAKDVRLEEVPEPSPARGHVVIQVGACGICGSDLHEYLHGPVYIPKTRHPLTGLEPPVTLGHEFAGRIVAVGEGVEASFVGRPAPDSSGRADEASSGRSTIRESMRVAVNPCVICGECAWCRRGQTNHCAKLACIGLSSDGALAPFVHVPAYACHPLPPEVDDQQGAMVEPLSVAIHAVRRSRVEASERVAIIGAGTIGLLVLQVLKARGAAWVAVVEPREDRRRLATAFRADVVLDPAADDPSRVIARLTGDERADVAFECVGSPTAFGTALRAAGKGGRIISVGLVPEPVQLNLLTLLAHEKEIIGSSAYVDEFPEAIRLIADRRVRVEPLVTARIPLAEARTRGLDALLRPEEGHIKILIMPS
jgi:(R,R)-butanediol dehydrogenase / meso-butanediol dehydrogenase / diacetyl reductase